MPSTAPPAAALPRPKDARLVKRSVSLAGHPTSVAVEAEFWAVLDAMAAEAGLATSALVLRLDAGRAGRPLASACRVAALAWALEQAAGSSLSAAQGKLALTCPTSVEPNARPPKP